MFIFQLNTNFPRHYRLHHHHYLFHLLHHFHQNLQSQHLFFLRKEVQHFLDMSFISNLLYHQVTSQSLRKYQYFDMLWKLVSRYSGYNEIVLYVLLMKMNTKEFFHFFNIIPTRLQIVYFLYCGNNHIVYKQNFQHLDAKLQSFLLCLTGKKGQA